MKQIDLTQLLPKEEDYEGTSAKFNLGYERLERSSNMDIIYPDFCIDISVRHSGLWMEIDFGREFNNEPYCTYFYQDRCLLLAAINKLSPGIIKSYELMAKLGLLETLSNRVVVYIKKPYDG